MSKARKVSNLMALAVLSVLTHRPMHPYEMAAAMRGWGKDRDMEIKWGSLYTVVRNLAKHGLIEAVESSREGRRPERTVYWLTGAGRTEMIDWTRELISTLGPELPRFRAGLSVLSALPPDEAAGLLRIRLDCLDQRIEAERAELAAHADDVHRLFLIEEEYGLTLLEAEARWIRGVLAELEAGTFPGLDDWRAYHEGGEPSQALTDLAEDAIKKNT